MAKSPTFLDIEQAFHSVARFSRDRCPQTGPPEINANFIISLTALLIGIIAVALATLGL